MEKTELYGRRQTLWLVFATSVLLVLALGIASFLTVRLFEATLTPELDKKATILAESIEAQLVRPYSYQVPLERLVGVDEFLGEVIGAHDEIQFAAVTDPSGRVLFKSGTLQAKEIKAGGGAAGDLVDGALPVAYPLTQGNQIFGYVQLGVDPAFVSNSLREIVLDILVTLFVSMLVAFELLLVFTAQGISIPVNHLDAVLAYGRRGSFSYLIDLKASGEIGRVIGAVNNVVLQINERYQRLMEGGASGRSPAVGGVGDLAAGAPPPAAAKLGHIRLADVIYVRLPVFVFFFASELSRSFLPIFAKNIYEPLPGLSSEVAIAMPISAYLFVAAVLTPFVGGLNARLGSRRLFLLGLGPAILGYALTYFATTLVELILWRMLNAVGFATISIAALGYIADATTAENRARGMGTYLAAYTAAAVCGTSIGAILADRIGFERVFVVSAVLALLSGLILYSSLPRESVVRAPGARGLSLAGFAAAPRNGPFLALLVLGAIPLQLLSTGYVFYITTFYLKGLDNSQSAIGRVLMCHFIMVIVFGPIAAWLSDRYRRHELSVAIGGILAGLGAVGVLAWEDTWMVAISVMVIGVASALSTPAQGAVLLDLCEREFAGTPVTAVLSAFRLLERIGSVAGPLVAGALMASYSFANATAVLGFVTLVTGIFYLIVVLRPGRRRPAAHPKETAS